MRRGWIGRDGEREKRRREKSRERRGERGGVERRMSEVGLDRVGRGRKKGA